MYLLLAVELTSLARRSLPQRVWRRVTCSPSRSGCSRPSTSSRRAPTPDHDRARRDHRRIGGCLRSFGRPDRGAHPRRRLCPLVRVKTDVVVIGAGRWARRRRGGSLGVTMTSCCSSSSSRAMCEGAATAGPASSASPIPSGLRRARAARAAAVARARRRRRRAAPRHDGRARPRRRSARSRQVEAALASCGATANALSPGAAHERWPGWRSIGPCSSSPMPGGAAPTTPCAHCRIGPRRTARFDPLRRRGPRRCQRTG